MSSDSVLDRIRQNRNRATVPSRDDGLINKSLTEDSKNRLQNEPKPLNDLEPVSRNSQASETVLDEADILKQLKAELTSLPETQRHSAIVLEKTLDQALTRYCKENRITIEVFLEAAWLQATQDPALLQVILEESKRRYKSRKEAGKLRRLITMLERKGHSS